LIPEIYKKKVSVLMEIWGLITALKDLDREKIIDLLREKYEENEVKPFRGFKAENLYEKELISLYVIGKYGLNIYDEYKDYVEEVFFLEETLDSLAQEIHSSKSREEVIKYLSSLGDKEKISRLLRLIFTKIIFNFEKEEVIINVMRKINDTNIEDYVHTAKSFSRFYTAFMIAESIAKNQIKNKVFMDAMKKAIAVKIGFKYPLPKDEYIELILNEVFDIKRSSLFKVRSNV